MHLTLLIITNAVLAANNRGEGVGNVQTLQRIEAGDGARTVISAPALKRALRDAMIANGAKMWRHNDPAGDKKVNPAGYVYGENQNLTIVGATPPNPIGYDDEQFGFMLAEAKKSDTAISIKGACEFSTAVSTTPYAGDTAFTQGLKAGEPLINPFSSERHATRYQYTVTWDLSRVTASTLAVTLKSLASLAAGGAHSSNATELTPDTIVLALHKAPGRAGLQSGMFRTIPTNEPVDVAPTVAYARKLGSAEQVEVMDSLADVLALATPYCKA